MKAASSAMSNGRILRVAGRVTGGSSLGVKGVPCPEVALGLNAAPLTLSHSPRASSADPEIVPLTAPGLFLVVTEEDNTVPSSSPGQSCPRVHPGSFSLSSVSGHSGQTARKRQTDEHRGRRRLFCHCC